MTEFYVQVVLILEELGVPYTIHSFKFDDVKKPPFTDINPNGRAPGELLIFCGLIIMHLVDVFMVAYKSNRGPKQELDALGVWSYYPIPGRSIRHG